MSDAQQTVETQVWVGDTERGWSPEGGGYLRLVRTKSVREVYEELREILGEYPDGGEEYFTLMPELGKDDRGEGEWPQGRIVVFSVNGTSEGDYTHIEVHDNEGQRHLMMLGKTFMGRDASWAFARRIADILEA